MVYINNCNTQYQKSNKEFQAGARDINAFYNYRKY